jgi:hypothetical protein
MFSYRVSHSRISIDHTFAGWMKRGICKMRVADDVRKSVVFIGVMEFGRFVPKATGFLVLTRPDDRHLPPQKQCPVNFPFLVTAEHVVSMLQLNGANLFCRMNLHSGGIVIEPMADVHWLSHPGPDKLSDVAVTPFWINTDIVDQLYIPFLEPLDVSLR